VNDALFKIEIRKIFRELLNYGFQDSYRLLNKDKQEYTFWDYMAGSWQKNYGMRIDHFLVSNNLLENIKAIEINKKPRSKIKPSDHTPIEIEII
jgi:exodeoxyribonuclease-3